MVRKRREVRPPQSVLNRSDTAHCLLWAFTLVLVAGLGFLVYRAHQAACEEITDEFHLAAHMPREQALPPRLDREPMVAIIIDDLGRDMKVARKFINMEFPLTLAVLPYRRFSVLVSSEGHKMGKEIILHLPMEPMEYPKINPGVGCIFTSMSNHEIQAEVSTQINSLPYCAGVSNHMGSLFTEKSEPMCGVFSVLKENGLFFVDSRTTPISVAPEIAGDFGVSFCQRTHFIDHERDQDRIIQQLCRLVDFAARYGGAIGVGHPYDETLEALPKAMESFAQKGVRLVPVSEMLYP